MSIVVQTRPPPTNLHMTLLQSDNSFVKVYDIHFSQLINAHLDEMESNQLGFNVANEKPTLLQQFIVYDVNEINASDDSESLLPYITFMGYSSPLKCAKFKNNDEHVLDSPNLFVNRVHVTADFSLRAIADTGSMLSVISQSVLKGMKDIKISPCDDAIRLRGFANDQLSKPIGTVELYLRASLRSAVPITFYILPEQIFGNKTIVGYSDLKRLGIDLSYESFSEHDFRLDLNPDTPRWKTMSPEEQHNQVDVDKIMSFVSDSLNLNRIVKDKNEPCSHPQAVYTIKSRLKHNFHQDLSSYPKNYSPEAQQIVDDGVEDLIKRKVLVPVDKSKCKALLNFVLVRREGREVRLCVDTVNFNKGIYSVNTELTSANQLFNRLKRKGFKYISALDISKAYYCLPIAEEDVGFLYVKHKGQYLGASKCVMGISDLPKFFCAIMSDIFNDLIQEEKILVYFDDILVLSKTLEENCTLVDEVIKRLNANNLPLNIDKCKFAYKKLKYLGMIIDHKEMSADGDKVQGIINTPNPINYTELMSLLGLANYIRRFILFSSELTSELYETASEFITKKKKPFPPAVQEKVNRLSKQLKQSLNNLIALSHPPENLKNVRFIVHTDASDIGYGGVLSYVDEKGKVVPMSTYRKKLNKYEANYTIPKKELLAVTACVRHWEEFLIHQQFTLYTDHIALTYLLGSDSVDHRTVKGWLSELSRFNYVIKHISGENNNFADFLSRQGCLQQDNHSNTMVVNHIRYSKTVDVATARRDTQLMEFLYAHDEEMRNAYAEFDVNVVTRSQRQSIESANPPASTDNDFVSALMNDNVVDQDLAVNNLSSPSASHFEGDVDNIGEGVDNDNHSVSMLDGSDNVVNNNEDIDSDEMFVRSINGSKVNLFHYPNAVRKKASTNFFTTPDNFERQSLLQKAHDSDHGSVGSMVRRILNEGFYWPNMHKDAQVSRNSCTICDHWNKIHQYEFLSSKSINASFPWEWVQMDLSGPKKRTSKGNEYILVLVDVLSSFVFLRPLKSKEAQEVADALIEIFADQGFPKIIQSDNGTEFDNKTVSDLIQKAAVDRRFSSAYKPSTNGQVERSVGSLSQLLNKLCMQFVSEEWDLLLPSVQLSLNTRVNEKTGNSPFFTFYFRNNGNQGVFGYDNSFAVPEPLDSWFQSEGFLKLRNEYLEEIARCKYEAGEKQKSYLDSIRPIAPRAEVGTHVFVKNVRKDKSTPIWDGPYIVIGHDDRDNHILKQLKGGLGAIELDRAYPREQIKVIGYRSTDCVEDKRFIEAILDERESEVPGADQNDTEYLVKFRGYEDKKDLRWLSEEDFDDLSLISNYKATIAKRATKGDDNGVVRTRSRQGRRRR